MTVKELTLVFLVFFSAARSLKDTQSAYKIGYMCGYVDRQKEQEEKISEDLKTVTESEFFSREGSHLNPEYLKGYRQHIKDTEEQNAIDLRHLKRQAQRTWNISGIPPHNSPHPIPSFEYSDKSIQEITGMKQEKMK